MTYGDVTVVPGPRLNLVLGPNGTGKSSLVNALCLGLGGAPNLLGRAESVKDFVRKGCQQGSTEIHLSSGSDRPIIITRQMNSEDGTSKWLLNNQASTKENVLKKVADLKIQVDNLCQFLPQDKVVMFARLSPIELLRETEKAIGSGHLWELHQSLADKANSLRDDKEDVQRKESDLEHNRQANSALEREVQRFKERDDVLKKVTLLNQRLPWLRYEECKADYRQLQDQQKAMVRELEHKQRQLTQQQLPLREHEKAAQSAAQAMRQGRAMLGKLEPTINTEYDASYALCDEMEVQHERIQSLDEAAQEHAANLERLQKKVDDTRAELQELGPGPQVGAARSKELSERQLALGREYRDAQGTLETLTEDINADQAQLTRLKGSLRELDNEKAQRLHLLEQRNPGITEVTRWIQDHKDQFRGQVLGPIACEVECGNSSHKDMLEQHIAGQVWVMFVTEQEGDQEFLMAKQRELRWRYKPTISCFNGDPSAPLQHPKGDPSTLSRYGVTHTLDQVFTAPGLVKHVLAAEGVINETYICERGAEQHVEELSVSHGITTLWTPDNQIRINVSLYNSAARSQMVIPIRPARMLKVNATNSSARQQLAAQIKEKEEAVASQMAGRQGAKEALQAVEAQREEVRREQKAITDDRARHERKVRTASTKLKAEEANLAKQRTRPDPRDEKPQLEAELKKTAAQAVARALKSVQVMEKMWGKMKNFHPVGLQATQLDLIVDAMKKAGEGLDDEVRAQKVALERFESIVAEGRHRVVRALEVADTAMGGRATEAQKQAFRALDQYGTDVAAVEASVELLQAEADRIICTNPRVMEEHRKRCEHIAKVEAELREKEDQVAILTADIASLEERWLPELRDVTMKINATFSQIFAKIACAGEVVLHVDQYDYNLCAMHIKVKFREAEELQPLNAQRQSGGERSVSTILYLVALQGVAACPFRIVDEINQGMDPQNERKVFLELVRAATGEGTPQAFLLTPKLLPELPFSPAVTVLQIMNGPHIAGVATGFTQETLCRQPIAAC